MSMGCAAFIIFNLSAFSYLGIKWSRKRKKRTEDSCQNKSINKSYIDADLLFSKEAL